MPLAKTILGLPSRSSHSQNVPEPFFSSSSSHRPQNQAGFSIVGLGVLDCVAVLSHFLYGEKLNCLEGNFTYQYDFQNPQKEIKKKKLKKDLCGCVQLSSSLVTQTAPIIRHKAQPNNFLNAHYSDW
ncbi:hypothetical protein L1049_003400 [Liquidambar formosana]|uniref:Uncharacterized protein n=1 Tax=Liquidambar formosana TaxID=63359 RepID=A0AAP0R1I0_LIQFO